MVREYDVIVRVRVATYASDVGVKIFADDLAVAVAARCRTDQAFVCEGKPTVQVNYDTRT